MAAIAGVRVRLPRGYVIDGSGDGYVQAGHPADRVVSSTNILVPGFVVDERGELVEPPPEVDAWLRQLDGIHYREVGTVHVDGVGSPVVFLRHERPGLDRTFWCGASAQSLQSGTCFRTGKGVVYAIVPFSRGTLVLEGPDNVFEPRPTQRQLRRAVDGVRRIARGVRLPD